MSPTYLGNLPTDQPLPVGVVSRCFGAQEGWFAWPPLNWAFQANDSLQMAIYVTPRYRCWWIVHGNLIFQTAGAWVRNDIVLDCRPADRNGIGFGAQALTSGHPVVPWESLCLSACFLLEANTSYVCYMLSQGGDANTTYYRAQRHLNMFGYTIGEGTI